MRRSVVRGFSITLGGLLLMGAGAQAPSQQEPRAPATTAAQAQGPAVAPARPLPALSLSDLTGTSRPLRQRSDEVTVINFWATWCVPCLKELPELVKLSHEWQGHGVQVVGIAIDSGKPANIRAFTARHGMDYLVLVANQRWAREHFGVFGLPVTIVVDRGGRIRQQLTGPQTGSTFAAAVQPYL